MKRLALFDLDGTLTSKDTFLEFIRFVKGDRSFVFGMVMNSPVLVLYKLGLYPNWKAKERVLTYFLKGMYAEEVRMLGDRFAETQMNRYLKKAGLDKLNEHIESGDDVYIVTASCEEWVCPWVKNVGIQAICTRLEKMDGKLTGKILGKNNYGPEKAVRIREQISVADYQEIFAYGDSRGDREMFELASRQFYRVF